MNTYRNTKSKTFWMALLLVFATDLYGLDGKVTDSQGKPVYGAIIEIVGNQGEVSTDQQGRFHLEGAQVYPLEIHVSAPGFSHQILHLNQQTQDISITLKPTAIMQVDVTATVLHTSTMESAQPVSVLSGKDLRREQTSTLGESLKNEVGVHSSYFGPIASSPIIRGLGGPRVLITQNNLDVSDASRVGPDHVVASEPSTANQIEILRGPATLFHGSGAIGGVVNVVDDRVPSSNLTNGSFLIGHHTVNDETEGSLSYNAGTDRIAFHFDGFWRDGDDYDIPGEAELESDEHHEDEHEDEHEHETGILENSASESKGFNVGSSVLLDNGFIGLSYGRLERLNGIPGHSHDHGEEGHEDEHHEGEDHEDEHGEEEVISDLKQDRFQIIGKLQLESSWLKGLNLRMGYTEYEHVEIENELLGTTFSNETFQARADLILKKRAGWHSAISVEGKTTDFAAIGEEAFTSPSVTDSYAVALVQEKHFGDLLWQLGGRVEHVNIEADPIPFEDHHAEHEDEHEELLHFDPLDFTPFSLSAGLVWDFAADYNAGFSLTHSQRAPSASELFSFGPHIGTGTYEVGALFELHETDDPHFDYGNEVDKEISNNFDLTLRRHSGEIGFVVNLFYNQIDNFYYERNTGLTSEDIEGHDHEEHDHEKYFDEEEEHDHGSLPVYVFEQADSNLYGAEAQFAWKFSDPFTLTFWGDTIRGKLDGGGNLPRISPTRFGSKLRFENKGWEAGLHWVRYQKQDNIADHETQTDGYSLLSSDIGYTFFLKKSSLTLFLQGRNLTDEEARVHSSFLKDRAPLPGRSIHFGLRGNF